MRFLDDVEYQEIINKIGSLEVEIVQLRNKIKSHEKLIDSLEKQLKHEKYKGTPMYEKMLNKEKNNG